MKIEPLQDRILIQRFESQERLPSGIYTPTSERSDQGHVIVVGPGKSFDDVPINMEPGDLVIFEKGAGHPIRVDGVDYIVLREDEVIARITE